MKRHSDRQVSAFDAKTHLSRLLHEAEQGRTIVITRRGKPVARLVPAQDPAALDPQSLIAAFRVFRQRAGKKLNVKRLIDEGRKY